MDAIRSLQPKENLVVHVLPGYIDLRDAVDLKNATGPIKDSTMSWIGVGNSPAVINSGTRLGASVSACAMCRQYG
jgi:hypothetical protein